MWISYLQSVFEILKEEMDQKELSFNLWKAEFNAIAARRNIYVEFENKKEECDMIVIDLCMNPNDVLIEMNVGNFVNLYLFVNQLANNKYEIYYIWDTIDLQEKQQRILDRSEFFEDKLLTSPSYYQSSLVVNFLLNYNINVQWTKGCEEWNGLLSIREKNIYRKLHSYHEILRQMKKHESYANQTYLILSFYTKQILDGFDDEQIYFQWKFSNQSSR